MGMVHVPNHFMVGYPRSRRRRDFKRQHAKPTSKADRRPPPALPLATLEQDPCPSRPISRDDSAFLIPSSRRHWRVAETLRSSSPPFPMQALWDLLVLLTL